MGLQQSIANQAGFLQDLFNSPTSSTVANVMEQLQDNLVAVSTGITLQNASTDVVSTVTQHTLGSEPIGFNGWSFVFNILPEFIPSSVDPATVTPILNFLASPESGVIMGALGPAISPWVALMNSINDGDDLNTTLANMVGAYFNGADLNLDGLIPVIAQSGFFPAGLNIENLDIAFGGLLTAGAVTTGPYQVLGSGGDVVASVPAVGGSILNSVGIELTGVPALGTLTTLSQAVGPLGAWEAMGQIISALLGSGWESSIPGTPVDVTAPLAGVDLPTIPTDVDLDDGGVGGAAAADSFNWLQDLLAGLGL